MISSAPPFGYLGRLEVRVFLRSAVEDSFYSVSVPYSGSIHLILQGTGGEATILQGVPKVIYMRNQLDEQDSLGTRVCRVGGGSNSRQRA